MDRRRPHITMIPGTGDDSLTVKKKNLSLFALVASILLIAMVVALGLARVGHGCCLLVPIALMIWRIAR